MRVPLATLILAIVAIAPPLAANDRAEAEVRAAADTFGAALSSARLDGLEPLLPERGKVRMRLICMGPEDGHFSRGQVQALLDDFLGDGGSVSAFKVLSVDGAGTPYAMVRARGLAVDRFGRGTALDLHLGFVRESDRWVLREIRETAP